MVCTRKNCHASGLHLNWYAVICMADGGKWETSNFDFDKFEHAKFSKTSITNGGSKLKFKVFWVMSSKKVRKFGWTQLAKFQSSLGGTENEVRTLL